MMKNRYHSMFLEKLIRLHAYCVGRGRAEALGGSSTWIAVLNTWTGTVVDCRVKRES